MEIWEFGLAHVCFQYYGTENINNCPKHCSRPYNPDPNPDPTLPYPTHRISSGKNPTIFFVVENSVDHIKNHTRYMIFFPDFHTLSYQVDNNVTSRKRLLQITVPVALRVDRQLVGPHRVFIFIDKEARSTPRVRPFQEPRAVTASKNNTKGQVEGTQTSVLNIGGAS